MAHDENFLAWRIALEEKYVVLCKFCFRKIVDPGKHNEKQVFYRYKCPYCGMYGKSSHEK